MHSDTKVLEPDWPRAIRDDCVGESTDLEHASGPVSSAQLCIGVYMYVCVVSDSLGCDRVGRGQILSIQAYFLACLVSTVIYVCSYACMDACGMYMCVAMHLQI
jgi:hypothetical protein